MFELHLNEIIENSMNDENVNSNKSSPSTTMVTKKIQNSKGGLKDLIIHPNSSGSSPIITTPTSNSSSGSSTPKTSISALSSTSNKTKTANSSTIKSTQRKDQSLREVLEDWRTEFYPNLTFDDFNEYLKPVNSTGIGSDKILRKNKNLDDIDTIDEEEEEEEEEEETESSNEDSDTSSNSSKSSGNNYKNINYYEYLENCGMLDNQNSIDEEQEDDEVNHNGFEASTTTKSTTATSGLLEQRVKQWMKDIHFDIEQSSKIFINQLPPQILESPLLSTVDSELPMTPSTKESPNPNSKSKSKFDLWRESFNKTMDEQMLEKKRTNKITITSNK